MKKLITIFILSSLFTLAEEDNKLGISTKIDNFKLEAVYKKKLSGYETDLKSYFKSGNSIDFNFTYLIGDENDPESLGVSNFKRNLNVSKELNKSDYTLNNTEGLKKVIHNVSEISTKINTVKFNVSTEDNIKEKEKKVKIFNTYSKKILKNYGKINMENIKKDEIIKKDKIEIVFDN